MFPPVVIALQRELKNHPDIAQYVQECGARGMDEEFGAIATKLGIILDGLYDPIDLCDLLLKRLKQRGEVIVLSDPRLVDIRLTETKDAVTIDPIFKTTELTQAPEKDG